MVHDAETPLATRARVFAALGDPARLAIVDELTASDRSPAELRARLGLESNLLAHHLDVLERARVVGRSRSSGDGRRRYVHLLPAALAGVLPGARVDGAAVFVCTANSARSQLAAALWRSRTGHDASSAGTHPAAEVHPRARAAAARAGLDLAGAVPVGLDAVDTRRVVVVTVCDRAHEELSPAPDWLHWSIADPVAIGTRRAFDATVAELDARIRRLVAA